MTQKARSSRIEIQQIFAVNPDLNAGPRRILVVGVADHSRWLNVQFPDYDAIARAAFFDPKRSFTYFVSGLFASDLFDDIENRQPGSVWIAEFDVAQYPGLWHLKCGPQAQPLQLQAYYLNGEDEPVKRTFDKLLIQEGYDIGVLFVHGIGQQRSADTLSQCSSAIQNSINFWFDNSASYLASRFRLSDVYGWEASARVRKDWSDYDVDYRRRMELVNRFLRKVEKTAPAPTMKEIETQIERITQDQSELTEQEKTARSQFIETNTQRIKATAIIGGASFTTADLIDSGRNPMEPSNTELRIEAIEADGYLQKSNWLLAETHWAESFRPPSFSNFARWCFYSGPVALTYYFGTLVRRSGSHYFRSLHKLFLLAALIALAEFIFMGMLLLALVPISKVRQTLMEMQQTLTGVLGDSYTFINDELQRRAIVDRVRRDLRWLLARCRTVVVVAHSQGAAVAFQALDDSPEGQSEKLNSVVTLGSGFQTLDAIKKALSSTRTLAAGWLAILGITLQLPAGWWLTHDQASLGLIAVIVGILALLLGGVNAKNLHATEKWLPPRMGLLKPWLDFYATCDAVPFGPVVDKENPKQLYRSREIKNRDSLLADHNSYWENTEEFVTPLVRHIATSAGYPALAKFLPDDDEILSRAAQCRHHRVGFLKLARWMSGFCALVLLGAHAGSVWRISSWAIQRTLVAFGLSQVTPAGPDSADLLSAFLPFMPLFIYTTVLMPMWTSWGSKEFSTVLQRASRSTSYLWLTLFVLTMATMGCLSIVLILVR
jgi:pimeloyl-ACP methyl ester carboxylesterase